MTDLKHHPLAALFPMMEGTEFNTLVVDIRQHGLRDPILLMDGMILDGRNRHRACQQAGVTPRFTQWTETISAHSLVMSKNLHRRHLNETQRATIAAKLSNVSPGDVSRHKHKTGVQITLAQAAELMNVSRGTVAEAKTVLTRGTADEIASIENGTAAATTIARRIRRLTSPVARKKEEAAHVSTKGKNPARLQQQQINIEVWGHVREALLHLTSLPMAKDTAKIVRTWDKTNLVDARVDNAVRWLIEFAKEWRS